MLLGSQLTRGQQPQAPASQFAGCYQVTATRWNPPLEDRPTWPPRRIKLATNAPFSSANVFAVASLDSEGNPHDNDFSNWEPISDGIKLLLSGGRGGMRGTLHVNKHGDLEGKIKQFCDFRCDFKRETVRLELHRVDCESPAASH